MPNRILKESICVSDSIDSLSWFEEVLFYRLIVNCDDFGRFDGRAAVIKNRLFPLKDDLTLGTVKAAIQKLVSAGLVITYESMGKPYLYLPTWSAHQTARAKKSKYPAPDSGNITPAADVKSPENICKQMNANAPVFDIRESNSIFDIRDAGSDVRPPARVSTPTFEQVMEVAKLRGCPECAKPFFDYYAAAGWRDSEGKPVYSWQQKLVLWQQREERRKKPQKPPFGGKVSTAPEDPNAVRKDMERMEEYRRKLREEAGKEEES